MTWKGDMILTTTTPYLSEGGAHATVVRDFPETPHQTRDDTDFLATVAEKAKRGCASRVPLSPGATARRTRGVAGGESDPPFLDRWCGTG